MTTQQDAFAVWQTRQQARDSRVGQLLARAEELANRGQLRPVVSKRTAKQAGRGPRQQRARQFKWAFMTGGNNPPLRHKFGLP